jgi:hypothetical protein
LHPLALKTSEELISQLKSTSVLSQIKKSQRIAITVRSRGISNQPIIVKTLIDELKKAGAKPFMIPAMGSHTESNPKNQKTMIEGLDLPINFNRDGNLF